MPPKIAAGFHGDVGVGALVDDDVADVGAFFERFVNCAFECDFFAATPAAVGGDDECGVEILGAGFQGFGREAAEDDGMRDTEASAGEERDGELGNHGHVDDGAVAGFVAEIFESGGEAADEAVEFGVGDGALVTGFAFKENGGFGAVAGSDVAVETVEAGVNFATGEPFGEGRVGPVESFSKGLEPGEFFLAEVGPELFWIGFRAVVEGAVSVEALDVGAGSELGAGRMKFQVAHGWWLGASLSHGADAGGAATMVKAYRGQGKHPESARFRIASPSRSSTMAIRRKHVAKRVLRLVAWVS